MLGVVLRRDLAAMSREKLINHMTQMDALWAAWGRPTDDHLPKNFLDEVVAVREELVRRGQQLSLF
jgi:hypothetical protein